ncbi:MAG: hypothetical protein M3257_01505 [Actinomycetota bacterium]|nr:hypothetical protein [Actinomycetota bacterium]
MAGTGVITKFVGELDGPHRIRASLLAEVRDGLDDAAAHTAAAACQNRPPRPAQWPSSAG